MPPPPHIAPVFENSPEGYFGKTVSNRAWHLKGFMGLIQEFRELFSYFSFQLITKIMSMDSFQCHALLI